MAKVKITARRNGPFRVEDPEGLIELVDADGNKYDLTGKPAFSLSFANSKVVSGVTLAGLIMTVFPAAKAGTAFHANIMNG